MKSKMRLIPSPSREGASGGDPPPRPEVSGLEEQSLGGDGARVEGAEPAFVDHPPGVAAERGRASVRCCNQSGANDLHRNFRAGPHARLTATRP